MFGRLTVVKPTMSNRKVDLTLRFAPFCKPCDRHGPTGCLRDPSSGDWGPLGSTGARGRMLGCLGARGVPGSRGGPSVQRSLCNGPLGADRGTRAWIWIARRIGGPRGPRVFRGIRRVPAVPLGGHEVAVGASVAIWPHVRHRFRPEQVRLSSCPSAPHHVHARHGPIQVAPEDAENDEG